MKSPFLHTHSEHPIVWFRASSRLCLSRCQRKIPWSGSGAISPADGRAMSHPLRAVSGCKKTVGIRLETQGTGGNYLPPSLGSPFSYSCFIKDILSQKDTISFFF